MTLDSHVYCRHGPTLLRKIGYQFIGSLVQSTFEYFWESKPLQNIIELILETSVTNVFKGVWIVYCLKAYTLA